MEYYAQQIIEFVRAHEAWAAPIVFALRLANRSPSSRFCCRPGPRWWVSAS